MQQINFKSGRIVKSNDACGAELTGEVEVERQAVG